jgi:hypothetical protein
MSPRQSSATVSLVALCFIAVLGVTLASYLAVSTQAIKFSNRAYAVNVSRHLAEMGMERALRSFNFNTFSSWTLSGITASETLTTSSSTSLSTLGSSGITPSVNIKVYHYRTTNKATVWTATPGATAYAVGDYVWYQGVWYLCLSTPGANAPSNATYWTAAPEPWNANANYQTGNIVVYGGSAYRCIVANTNKVPPNATFWTAYAVADWNASTTYSVNDVVLFGGIPYRCISAHSNHSPPDTTYWLGAPAIYSEGIATLNDSSNTVIKTQLRALLASASLFPNALGATTLVTLPTTATVDSYNQPLSVWSAAYPYQVGDAVRVGTTYYRCTAANTNQTPPNASYWSTTAPLGYAAVIAGGNTAGTAVSVISATMGGYVTAPPTTTTPYTPQASFGASTTPNLKNSDGTVTSPLTGSTNIDQTRISRTPYIPQFDIQSVTGAGNLPSGGTSLPDANTTLGTAGATSPSVYNITGTYNGATLNPGLYLNNSKTLTIDGPVILNVSGPLYTYPGQITITTNGSLEVYFTGQLYVGFSGAYKGITNQTYDPKKCILVGTSTANATNSHYYWTTEPFYGVIYMPNAYVSTWTNVNIYGAISAKNIGFPNAGGALHYDTSLRSAGKISTFVDGPYVISQMRELTSPSEKITLP